MIKINLLPTEKRKAERTPLPRFLLIASTAAAFFILVFYNLFILKLISDVKNDIALAKAERQRLEPDVQRHAKLTEQRNQLAAKVQEIKDLIGRDVEYWRTVNALWDVIHMNPRVWIDDIRILDTKTAPSELKRIDPQAKDATPYGVSLRCHVAGDDVAEMTKFRKSLKDNLVLQETLTLINFNVDWTVVDEKVATDESHSISFSISMFGLATPPTRKKPAPPPAGPASVPIKATPTPAPGGPK